MQTFKLDIATQLRVVVPEPVLQNAVAEARSEDAPEYLKALLKQHTIQEADPENDIEEQIDLDQFMLAVLIVNLRGIVKTTFAHFITARGMGGSVAPARATTIPFGPNDDDLHRTERAEDIMARVATKRTTGHEKQPVLLLGQGNSIDTKQID